MHADGPRLEGGASAFVERVQELYAPGGSPRKPSAHDVKAALESITAALTDGQRQKLLGQLPDDLDHMARTQADALARQEGPRG